LSKLYEPEYLDSFSPMRQVMNLTIYILLMIDLTGTGAEFARHPLRKPGQCLLREDVELYGFHRSDDDYFNEQARITIRWAKETMHDGSRFTTVPLAGLLPRELALQNTLWLLLVLALVDGICRFVVF
jgi:hypothetical protein